MRQGLAGRHISQLRVGDIIFWDARQMCQITEINPVAKCTMGYINFVADFLLNGEPNGKQDRFTGGPNAEYRIVTNMVLALKHHIG